MKRIWLLHVAVVGLILSCGFSPWLVVATAILTKSESLEDWALVAGYAGMGLTPLGLLVAAVYAVAATIYHLVATRWRGRKPISVGKYVLVWLGIVVVGAIVAGWALLAAP
jgi:hypothetical protein